MLHSKLERTDTRNLCSDSQLLNAVPTQTEIECTNQYHVGAKAVQADCREH